MKKKIASIAKIATLAVSVTLLVYSVFKLIQLAKERDIISVVFGFKTLADTDKDIIDISGNGVKFLGHSNDVSIDAFQNVLSENGYSRVGKFGKSDLYEYDGEEIIVKRSKILNNYYLFEVFNDTYFSEM